MLTSRPIWHQLGGGRAFPMILMTCKTSLFVTEPRLPSRQILREEYLNLGSSFSEIQSLDFLMHLQLSNLILASSSSGISVPGRVT
jgi:hypothetical protein